VGCDAVVFCGDEPVVGCDAVIACEPEAKCVDIFCRDKEKNKICPENMGCTNNEGCPAEDDIEIITSIG